LWTMFGPYLGHVWAVFGPCLDHVWACTWMAFQPQWQHQPRLSLLCACIWRVAWSNFRLAKNVARSLRARLIYRCTTPLVLFATRIWPWSHNTALTHDQLQRLCMCLLCTPNPNEDPFEFRTRKTREAGAFIDTEKYMHKWSVLWAKSVLLWDDHLMCDYDRQCNSRDRPSDQVSPDLTSFSFSPVLHNFHDASWIEALRTVRARDKVSCRTRTSTGTRAGRGKVQLRWEEALVGARAWVDIHAKKKT
jgi:hypothetical protein